MSSVLPFVRGVDFSRNEFKDGHFQRKVMDMSNLRWLRLNRASLQNLPEEIDQLEKLEVINVSHNHLSKFNEGTFSSLDGVRVMNACHNQISDSGISSDFFIGKEIVTLDLSYNNLTKVPEKLTDCKNLIVLSLSHNKITTVPGSMFVHLSGIEYMDLSNNELQSLPPQLRRLEHLFHMNLSNNPMQHYTIKVLDKLSNLTMLNMSNTGRDFTNTPHLDKLTNLTDIDFSHNELSRIPEPIYLLEKLRRVNMSHNNIRELSSLVDTWVDLMTFDVSSNLLTSLHPNLCKCTKLKRLFLSDNKLTFEGIPPAISKLTELEHFIAARNQLECIPDGLCRCYHLKRLILTSNSLLTLPEGIHYVKFEMLEISDNPKLVMPPKPTIQVKGSGDEWYNINFDPQILCQGVVEANTQIFKSSHERRMDRQMRKQKRMSSTSGRGEDEAAKKVLKGLADVAGHQQDVMSAGSGLTVKESMGEAAESSPIKPKRWDATLRRPDLDYSDIFSDDVGKLPGIMVWQIENFYPVLVEEKFHGHFYMADSYIVLKTFWNEMSELDWELYYWIGRDSSLDKKACSAMHAVNLRNMLGALGRTHREEQGDESYEFQEMFVEMTYIEGGTESGFFTVEDEDYAIRLFVLISGKRPFFEPVNTVSSSLDLGHVFLLDAGLELFVWYGNKSSINDRSKAQLISERIKKVDRKNKASLQVIRSGIEPDEFWELMGGYPEEPVQLLRREYVIVHPKLYKAGLGAGFLELPQVDLPQGRLVHSLLKSNEVYILDCHTEIYVWIGRNSSRLVRAAALRLAQELLEILHRPPFSIVSRCLEGAEPQVFKCRFVDWEEVLAVDFTKTPAKLEQRAKEFLKNPSAAIEKKAAKVDMKALFEERQKPMSRSDANELMERYNSSLLSMRCCVIQGMKFIILPNREKGHFYSAECYFFLCNYCVSSDTQKDEDSEETEEDEEESECPVVYFWQGREANNMGWLAFTLGIQKQLEEAMDGPIEVIHIRQQQEDARFLSHFGGKFIIHQGKRGSHENDMQPALYQIRANDSKICRRVVQVPAEPKYLNSVFCHILKVPFEGQGSGIVYIWIGDKASQEEAIHAEQMGRTMFESSYSNVVITEGSEPENFFWVALGGKSEYEKSAGFMNYRRLFRCSNEKGYFSVSEKYADFCQGDLSEEDVMLLDTGHEVFVWFGTNASDMEKKLGVKSAQVYIKHLRDEARGPKRKLKIAKRRAEPWTFTRCFHGWVDDHKP